MLFIFVSLSNGAFIESPERWDGPGVSALKPVSSNDGFVSCQLYLLFLVSGSGVSFFLVFF